MKEILILFLKGCIIGLASGMEGLSAGLMALLLGNYLPILRAIQSFNLKALKLIFTRQLGELAQHLSWKIWLFMPLGAVFARWGMPQLLPLTEWEATYKALIYSVICGQILASIAFTMGTKGVGGIGGILAFLGAISLGVLLLLIPAPTLTPTGGGLTLFIMGALTAFTEMVVGISDSLSNAILQEHYYISYYISQRYWPFIALFTLGAAAMMSLLAQGILLGIRFAERMVMAFLMGLMAVVLLQIWPLRYIQTGSLDEITRIGICFAAGIALSGIMQFFQRRTLG
jgi:putative membrane protein